MSNPSVTEISDERAAEWDAFVHAHHSSSYVHLAGWAGVFQRSFGHRTRRFALVDAGDQIVGVLPVTIVRSRLFGAHAVSVPFLNYGGALGDATAQRLLAEHAVVEAQRSGIRSVLFRGRAPQALPWDSATTKVTVLRPLPPSADALMMEFDAKLRSQIRRAQKEGATLHHGPSELEAFYAVFREHMRDLGTPVMPKRFFAEVIASFPEEARITTVRFGGVPIAGGFGFRWHQEYEITWASSLLAYKRMSPNMLLYWGVMSQCVAEGVRVFDFGRCNPGSSTHRFKRQWGGEDVPLHWYWPGQTAASVPRKEQVGFALAARFWRLLPLGLASRLGPYIVRGIP